MHADPTVTAMVPLAIVLVPLLVILAAIWLARFAARRRPPSDEDVAGLALLLRRGKRSRSRDQTESR